MALESSKYSSSRSKPDRQTMNLAGKQEGDSLAGKGISLAGKGISLAGTLSIPAR